MKLVDATYITDAEVAMRATLEAHPDLKAHLTRLISGYQELLDMAMQGGDMADIARSCAKKELALARIGIALEKEYDE